MFPPPKPSDTSTEGSKEQPSYEGLVTLFVRVISTLEKSIPYDNAQLVFLEDEAAVQSVTVQRGASEQPKPIPTLRRRYSEKLWPRTNAATYIIKNASEVLDRSYEGDRTLIESGAQSLLLAPLTTEHGEVGLLIMTSNKADDFNDTHVRALEPIKEYLAIATEREQLWEKEQIRQRRRAKFETLVPTIAQSLDVRKVFVQMSTVIKEVVPHDVLAFALLSPDRGGVRVQAATVMGVMELPEYRFSNEQEALDANWQFLLAYDLSPVDAESVKARISPKHVTPPVEVVVRPGKNWVNFVSRAGIRSTMRVPIRSKDKPIGGIAFMSSKPDAYDAEDGMLASRITDLVALALAHQKLADEERLIALTEERAQQLEKKVAVLTHELDRYSAHRAIGSSPAWKEALALATQVAATDTTVLITGESGTGKEVIARYIHRGSKREKGPFIALNCAAISEHLLESELFGHERGAFTGAVEARIGKIEQANGGVLFLDEIGEMAPPMQAKLLRVLQEREFNRVGGARTIKADVRIVAATNRDPRTSIANGSFREDLYYRLCTFEIHLPPLRERPDDILTFAETFLEEVGRSIGRPAAGISEDAREQLLVHNWPGNVRELRNAIERAVILCQGGLVTREHLPITVSRPQSARIAAAAPASVDFPVEGVALETVEKEMLVKAMAKAKENKSKAAKLLGISRGQLYSLLQKHGLTDVKR